MLPLHGDFEEYQDIKATQSLNLPAKNLPPGVTSRPKIPASNLHPGLLFDKFVDGWEDGGHGALADGKKKEFFSAFTKANYEYLKGDTTTGLDHALKQQEKLIRHLTGAGNEPAILPMKSDWRFISGLGNGHPYETGFIWHRTLGVPYLPGSSVKGLMRAWASEWEGSEIRSRVDHLFGPEQTDDQQTMDTGALIVFDAFPIKPPKLELDILTPHYGDYYRSTGDKPPADYHNPLPIIFLSVAPGQSFRFGLAPRPDRNNSEQTKDIRDGLKILSKALKTLGAGGKTAVGYGVFQDATDEMEKVEIRNRQARENILEPEERYRSEFSHMNEKTLAIRFGRKWNATMENFQGDFDLYIKILIEVHGDLIESWSDSGNKNQKKTHKKVGSYKEK